MVTLLSPEEPASSSRVTVAASVFSVAPTGAGAGPWLGAAASWRSLGPCTWSSCTSLSSLVTRSSLKRQVFSLPPPLTALPSSSRRAQKGGRSAQHRPPCSGPHIGRRAGGEPRSPTNSHCGRAKCTQSQVAGEAGREETKLPGRRFSLARGSSVTLTHM